jgi:cation diffusion facilitator CzcD-associated flavoprotein CzcO
MPPPTKTCIIGAGSSGIVAAQVLGARGLDYDIFEKGSQIGGNWRYENDNGMSSAYRSLHINTSRRVMAYKTLPMPDHYPDYPDHFQMAAYFDEFADHFGLREKVSFNTEVLRAEPVEGGSGGWDVTVAGPEGEKTNRYGALLVANGHHWDPRWPEPAFPGSEEFEGQQIHVHHYRESDVLAGKRVLVLGLGNSATDVAVESSRIAEKTFIATRRGAWVLPKYINGKPLDESLNPVTGLAPVPVLRFFTQRMLDVAVGRPEAYGLPKPDHKLFEAHPTVSSELLPRLGHGDITAKPNIERYEGGRAVRFVDGSREEIDLVVYCTGYKMTFPFFDPQVFSAPDNRLSL